MEKPKASAVYEDYKDGRYVEVFRTEDAARVYEKLGHAMVAYYLNKCTDITKIVKTTDYSGAYAIKVYVSRDGYKGRETITIPF